MALALSSACSSERPALPPVPVSAGAGAPSCPALLTALPHQLAAGLTARRTQPDAGSTAAWGEPPVTLRCGVVRGNPRDDGYEFDGVRWVVHDDGTTHRWTTLDRPVPVEVVIPDAYDGQAELLGTLAPALKGR